jgi:hypothetical protein
MNSKRFEMDNLQLMDLTEVEQVNINGGQDEVTVKFWEYFGKGAGYIYNGWKELCKNTETAGVVAL